MFGVPLTWLVLFLIQFASGGGGPYDINSLHGKFLAVTLQAPWLMPFENQLHWMIPAAMATLFVPFFFVSWWLEASVIWKRHRPEAFALASQRAQESDSVLQDRARSLVSRAVRNANALTYLAMLLGFVCVDLVLVLVGSG